MVIDLLQDTITYELPEPASENKAVEYFFVTPDTGVLHLKEDLQNDEERDTQYQVHFYRIQLDEDVPFSLAIFIFTAPSILS